MMDEDKILRVCGYIDEFIVEMKECCVDMYF